MMWGLIAFGFLLLLQTTCNKKLFSIRLASLLELQKDNRGDYSVVINENKEGDFAKLAISFRSMRDIIRKNMHDLLEEKRFLGEMLQDISHQLKTPLSTISIYNEMLLNEKLSREQQAQLLQNNDIQISRMNILIQEFVKSSKN